MTILAPEDCKNREIICFPSYAGTFIGALIFFAYLANSYSRKSKESGWKKMRVLFWTCFLFYLSCTEPVSLEHEILEFLLETWSIKTLIKLAELCTVLYDRAMSRGHYFTTPPPPPPGPSWHMDITLKKIAKSRSYLFTHLCCIIYHVCISVSGILVKYSWNRNHKNPENSRSLAEKISWRSLFSWR